MEMCCWDIDQPRHPTWEILRTSRSAALNLILSGRTYSRCSARLSMIAVVAAIVEVMALHQATVIARTRRSIRMYVGLTGRPGAPPGPSVDQDVVFTPAEAR